MEPSKALSPQRRRKTVPLPHSSGTEALWEPGSRAGAAPRPQSPPGRTHVSACCLVYPKLECSNFIVVLSGDNLLNGGEVLRSTLQG